MDLLCIEDDEGLLYLLRQPLEEAGMVVTEALDGEQGLQLLQERQFDAVIVDQEMPMITGLEVIRRARAAQIDVPIIMVTGAGNEEIAVEALLSGANDYLVKDTNLGYLKILPSVIHQVIRERELAIAHHAAERALELERERSKLLMQFVQNVSHEFRTPLTLIKSACYLLGRTSDELKQKTFIQNIEKQSDSILKLVEQLVHLSKLDNTSSLDFEHIDLNSLLRNVVEKKSAKITGKKLKVHLVLPEDSVVIRSDTYELQDAIGELIDNACRYSNTDGEISVSLSVDNTTATVNIRDMGIGMTQEQVSHIFDRFYRVDDAHSTPGFGLGLSIVSRIIDLHHGDIHVESELGKGTEVTLSLPIAESKK